MTTTTTAAEISSQLVGWRGFKLPPATSFHIAREPHFVRPTSFALFLSANASELGCILHRALSDLINTHELERFVAPYPQAS